MERDTQEPTSTGCPLHRNYGRPTARLVRNYEFETVISATKDARLWGSGRPSRKLLPYYQSSPGQAADVVVPMLQGV
jgi:hypothetical protein